MKNSKLGDLRSSFYGRLEDLSEETIKRIIMKLLIFKVLKEKFNSFRVEATILVYINVGRMVDHFKRGSIRIILTDTLAQEEHDELLRSMRETKKRTKGDRKDLKKKLGKGGVAADESSEDSDVEDSDDQKCKTESIEKSSSKKKKIKDEKVSSKLEKKRKKKQEKIDS